MTTAQTTFSPTCNYNLIYVFAVDIPSHRGCLKVGKATVHTKKDADELPPNCPELNSAAMERIKTYTNTVGVKANLLYTEIAVMEKTTASGKTIREGFQDKAVHAVLEHSHVLKKVFTGTTAGEWYEVDLLTVKNAIKAVKQGKSTLSSKEVSKEEPPVQLREEQRDAVDKTLARFKKKNDMLWDAKMRFGKTLTALQVIKEGGFQKVAIITHRPIVNSGWAEDYKKIFRKGDEVPYRYVDRSKLTASSYDPRAQKATEEELEKLAYDHEHFIYFASIQDLRGSQRVGGKFKKNEGVFDLDWDLLIIDEAHEGTQTELGSNVIETLRKKNTKVLALSGTPFNILADYEEDAVYVWDYVMEQNRKNTWDEKHPGEPNPYADLPRLNIYTYALGECFDGYTQEDLEGKAFNFYEFFRTRTGDEDQDSRKMPAGASVGDFVHLEDVKEFLNLITRESDTSRYPFSTEEKRALFKHTLWMVPGVAAAKALSEMLRAHKVFGHFGIANVAGEGDDYEDVHYKDALEQVKKTIQDNEYSITLSCGKLTTGVTVPEWTGVMMLAGSVNTAAAGYMQTIFRVQSAGCIDGRQKEDAYVFDFAPDRTLRVLAETVQISRKVAKNDSKEERAKQVLAEFLNYCPVISIDGTRMEPYDVPKMMGQLKHIFVMKAIRNGFDDSAIYSDKLMNLTGVDLNKFEELKGIVGESKQTVTPDSVIIDDQGFDDEEHSKKSGGKKPRRELTEEEKARLAELKKKKDERKRAISILRAISIRMPLLIYGADVPFEQDITLQDFPDLVDDESWKEFMPDGVTKKIFGKFVEYYDGDVFVNAGKEIRRLARSADKLTPTERVKQIARIFGYFKNPDKETVLTPWRVVNMHLSDTIGGWCFWNEGFTEAIEEPRYVQQEEVTRRLFGNSKARILEINSKSGLYPLYVAYSLYRNAIGAVPEEEISPQWRMKCWKEVVSNNLFVVCKTPMAEYITRRTLMGYQMGQMNTQYFKNLVSTLKDVPEKFVKRIKNGNRWNNEGLKMKQLEFDAIVGNPPYQEMDGGNGVSAGPVFNIFVEASKSVNPNYISMIIPARWYAGGKGLDDFRDIMRADDRIRKLYDYETSKDLFPTVGIAGGICYFLWDGSYHGKCHFNTIKGHSIISSLQRKLDSYSIVVRSNEAISILDKLHKTGFEAWSLHACPRNPFGYGTNYTGSKDKHEGDIEILTSHGYDYVPRKAVVKGKELVDKYKILIGRLVPSNGELDLKPNEKHKVITDTQLIAPGQINTETYLDIGVFDTKAEATNFDRYLKTRFVRFLLWQAISSLNVTRECFRFVPTQDFTQPWTDEKLYEKYGLTPEERAHIEATIRPMD